MARAELATGMERFRERRAHRINLPRDSCPLSLAEILLKGAELAGDRRKTRYVRLASTEGIARPDELKRKQPETEAVDPELDEVAKRLMRRIRLGNAQPSNLSKSSDLNNSCARAG
jgi:hypothetical protein